MKLAKAVKPVQLPSPEQDSNDEEDDRTDWTKRFNGLWQFQESSIVTEKAFNLVMSFGKSQCCICALFVTPSPFVVFEHKKLRSSMQCLSARETSKKRYGLAGLKVHVQLAYYTVIHAHYTHMYINTSSALQSLSFSAH